MSDRPAAPKAAARPHVDSAARPHVDSADDPNWNAPPVQVSVVEDHSSEARCDRGFLRLRRLQLKNRYPDGSESETYPYDLVERDAMDAVVVVLHRRRGDEIEVCVRSSLRPPLAVRPGLPEARDEVRDAAVEAGTSTGVLWELPAGLIEPDEAGTWEGVVACAVRETLEETGYVVAPDAFARLGPATYLSPGVLAERLFYAHASVDGARAGEPTLDGSPVEEGSEVRFVSTEAALAALERGDIADAKSEVALRRFFALRRGETRDDGKTA